MPKRRDIAGQKFTRLTAIKPAGVDKYKKALWECKCDCGEIKVVSLNLLTRKYKNVKSCGCLKEEIMMGNSIRKSHGKSDTNLYKRWIGIKQRCNNPNDTNYKWYGAKGIRMCQEWSDDFMKFYNWAKENGYKKHLEIDRKNVLGDYSPSNCRWIPKKLNVYLQRHRDESYQY